MSPANPEPETDDDPMTQWHEDIEERAAGRKHATARGVRRRPRRSTTGSYRAEGRMQCPDQMDIWACIAEAENDQSNTESADE